MSPTAAHLSMLACQCSCHDPFSDMHVINEKIWKRRTDDIIKTDVVVSMERTMKCLQSASVHILTGSPKRVHR